MKTIIEEGVILKVDEGEYDGYYVIGFYKVIKSFDWKQELTLFKNQEDYDDYFSGEDFTFFLRENGYLERIKYNTLYLGSCGDSDGVKYWQHS